MEQWLARWAHNPKVGGSNPPPATRIKAGSIFAKMLSALPYTINRKTLQNKTRTESKSRIPCGLSEILVLLSRRFMKKQPLTTLSQTKNKRNVAVGVGDCLGEGIVQSLAFYFAMFKLLMHKPGIVAIALKQLVM